MSGAAAFIAGFGGGYLKAQDKKREQDRQDKADARAEEDYQFRKGERDQAAADKAALRTAGADVKVEEVAGTLPRDEADMDMTPAGAESLNLPKTYKAGAASFAERGVAEAEATKQNAPGAKRERTAAAMASQGNMLGADQLRTSGLQGEAAQISIDAAKREQANQVFDDGLRKATAKGPDALAQFMSESHADGAAGAMKFKAVPSSDGKAWQMHAVGEDGSLKPVGGRFSNDENGYTTAAFMLSRAVKPEAKLAHSLALQEAERRQKHDDKSLSIAQQNADTNERYRRDMANQARVNAAHSKRVAEGKAEEGGAIRVGLKDMRDFESDMNGYIKDQFPVKDGADPKERAGINAQATSMKALGSAMFQNNAAVGIPLTAGTVMQAMELGRDRTNVKIVQVGGVPHEAVIVNGQPVLTSGPLQAKTAAPAAPAAPAPGAPAPNSAAAMTQQGVQAPAPTAAPAAAPAAPMSEIDRIQGAKLQTMAPLAQQFKQAEAQFVQAAKSGDQASIAKYMQAKEALRQQLVAQVTESFGNGADAALKKLLSAN